MTSYYEYSFWAGGALLAAYFVPAPTKEALMSYLVEFPQGDTWWYTRGEIEPVTAGEYV